MQAVVGARSERAGDPDAAVEYPPPDRFVMPGDEDTMRAMQRDIEAGARFVITGPPTKRDGESVVPVAAMH